MNRPNWPCIAVVARGVVGFKAVWLCTVLGAANGCWRACSAPSAYYSGIALRAASGAAVAFYVLGACAIGCFGWAPRGFAGNETSDCLLRSATRGHRPAGGRGMLADKPAGRADWGRIALLHAAASPCIRFMFSARHTRAHSPRAWSRPRTLKRRKPSACLIHPLGASDSHLRLA